jgi:hypothetical protein
MKPLAFTALRASRIKYKMITVVIIGLLACLVWAILITDNQSESLTQPEKPQAKAIHHSVKPASRPRTLRAWNLYLRRELFDTQRKLEAWK